MDGWRTWRRRLLAAALTAGVVSTGASQLRADAMTSSQMFLERTTTGSMTLFFGIVPPPPPSNTNVDTPPPPPAPEPQPEPTPPPPPPPPTGDGGNPPDDTPPPPGGNGDPEPPPPPNNVPEPATLLTGSIGAAYLAISRWRRRKQTA